MLTEADVNHLLLHLLDQQACDRKALARSVKQQIAEARAELAAAY